MVKRKNKEICYLEDITYFLYGILQIAVQDVRNEKYFEKKYQKRLNFQRITDWKKYTACLDLIVDTDYAILNAFEYQLGDLRRKPEHGEMYIRLYGIHNAAYLQIGAYKEVAKLINFPDYLNTIKVPLENCEIYKYRNVVASHTVNFDVRKQDDSSPNSNSYRVIAMDIEPTGSSIHVLDEYDNFHVFNLVGLLTEYINVSIEILAKLVRHGVQNLILQKDIRERLKIELNNRLTNLVDYTLLDKNSKYLKRKLTKTSKFTDKIEEVIIEQSFVNLNKWQLCYKVRMIKSFFIRSEMKLNNFQLQYRLSQK